MILSTFWPKAQVLGRNCLKARRLDGLKVTLLLSFFKLSSSFPITPGFALKREGKGIKSDL
jgi:hypothetical protein